MFDENIDDLMPLCKECHKKIHLEKNGGNKMISLVNKYNIPNVVETRKLVITPNMAQSFLDNDNFGNRNIRKDRVDLYKKLILEDQWEYNGASIKFSKDGKLLDGQHRLTAVVKANKSITSLVVFGLEEKTKHTIDAGIVQNLSDSLRKESYENARSLSPVLKMIDNYEKKKPVTRKTLLSNFYILELVERHPLLPETIKKSKKYAQKIKSVKSSIVNFLYYIFYKINDKETEYFFNSLATGANLSEESPILHLRNRIGVESSQKKVFKNSKEKDDYQIKIIIKAWNFKRQCRTCKQLKLNQDEEMHIPV